VLINIGNYGHFTHEIEGMLRPLHSKTSHWLKRPRLSNFTSHMKLKANGPKEILMDEKSAWIPTQHIINNVSLYAIIYKVGLTHISVDHVSGLAFG
jgi:hypothetical protein